MLTEVSSWKKLHLEIVVDNEVTSELRIKVRKGLEDLKLTRVQIDGLVDKLSVPRSTETLTRIKHIRAKSSGYCGMAAKSNG